MRLNIELLPASTFRLDVAILADFDQDEGRLSCPGCDEELSLQQPDSFEPDRLLGVCAECGAWYRVELSRDSGTTVMLTLPGHIELQDVLVSAIG